MSRETRFAPEGWLPALAGLLWLGQGFQHGWLALLAALLPGSLLLGSGVALLLMPGDRRCTQLAALGGALGALLALPAALFSGLLLGLALLATSLAAAAAAGFYALRLEPNTDEVPESRPSLALAAQVAVDEALLATMTLTVPLPRSSELPRIRDEMERARSLFEERGWLEKPAAYHPEPPPLEAPSLRPARTGRLRYEHLSFASGYEPAPGEPGRERWWGYAANRTAHAWMLRHPPAAGGAERPWLLCLHGYQMGIPLIDFAAFEPGWLHSRLGLNLLIPVQPLHGPRKVGRRSGDGFIGAEILDTIHAEAQAIWDVRRLLGWVRSQGAGPIAVLGYSLGGYAAALLASLDPELACVIPGIPLVDFARVVHRHGPTLQLQRAETLGLELEPMQAVLRVISPLAVEPRVARERRFLFGASADRIVPPDQVRDLWRHWERPRIEWYPGAHVTFRAHPGVRQLIAGALRETGLAG